MSGGVVMVGSFVVDLTSRQSGMPRPGETVLGRCFVMGAGGKGSNQAIAAHRAGAEVTLVTKLGKDMFANVALDFYRAEGISAQYVFQDEEMGTGVALILVDEISAQNEIVVVPSACRHFLPDEIASVSEAIRQAKILLVQMEINPEATFQAVEEARLAGVDVVFNPAPAGTIPADILRKISVITPNETEAEALTGVAIRNRDDARAAAAALLGKGVKSAVITLGSMGAYATDDSRELWLERIPVEAVDTTGAGDAFSGALAAGLAEGMNLFRAARFANAAAALSVTRLGTAPSTPFRREIDELYKQTYGEAQ